MTEPRYFQTLNRLAVAVACLVLPLIAAGQPRIALMIATLVLLGYISVGICRGYLLKHKAWALVYLAPASSAAVALAFPWPGEATLVLGLLLVAAVVTNIQRKHLLGPRSGVL